MDEQGWQEQHGPPESTSKRHSQRVSPASPPVPSQGSSDSQSDPSLHAFTSSASDESHGGDPASKHSRTESRRLSLLNPQNARSNRVSQNLSLSPGQIHSQHSPTSASQESQQPIRLTRVPTQVRLAQDIGPVETGGSSPQPLPEVRHRASISAFPKAPVTPRGTPADSSQDSSQDEANLAAAGHHKAPSPLLYSNDPPSPSAYAPLFLQSHDQRGHRQRRRTSDAIFLDHEPTRGLPPLSSDSKETVFENATAITSHKDLLMPDGRTGNSLSRSLNSPSAARDPSPSKRPINHRTSVGNPFNSHPTDEYAKILFNSRAAKMSKWRPSTAELFSGSEDDRVNHPPNLNNDPSNDNSLDMSFAELTNPSHEIEWVDWLEEYSRLKEAKTREDQRKSAVKLRSEESSRDEDKCHNDAQPEPEAEYTDTEDRHEPANEDVTMPLPPSHLTRDLSRSQPPTADTANTDDAGPLPGTSKLERRVSSASSRTNRKGFSSRLSLRSDYMSREGSSAHSYLRKRNLHLGAKIDSWWKAVRTSFTQHAGRENESREHHAGNQGPSSSSNLVSNVSSVTPGDKMPFNRDNAGKLTNPLTSTVTRIDDNSAEKFSSTERRRARPSHNRTGSAVTHGEPSKLKHATSALDLFASSSPPSKSSEAEPSSVETFLPVLPAIPPPSVQSNVVLDSPFSPVRHDTGPSPPDTFTKPTVTAVPSTTATMETRNPLQDASPHSSPKSLHHETELQRRRHPQLHLRLDSHLNNLPSSSSSQASNSGYQNAADLPTSSSVSASNSTHAPVDAQMMPPPRSRAPFHVRSSKNSVDASRGQWNTQGPAQFDKRLSVSSGASSAADAASPSSGRTFGAQTPSHGLGLSLNSQSGSPSSSVQSTSNRAPTPSTIPATTRNEFRDSGEPQADTSIQRASSRSKGKSKQQPNNDEEGSNSQGISLSSIQQHIKQRLASAKRGCDRELTKIVNSIATYVELELENERQKSEVEQSQAAEPLPIPSRQSTLERNFIESMNNLELSNADDMEFGTDEQSDSEIERFKPYQPPPSAGPPVSGSTSDTPQQSYPFNSAQSSPTSSVASLPQTSKRHSAISSSKPQPVPNVGSAATGVTSPSSPLSASPMKPLASKKYPMHLRRSSEVALSGPSVGSSQERPSRRPSRHTSNPPSESTSRSTSRSRSPLPLPARIPTSEWATLQKHSTEDDTGNSIHPELVKALQGVISIATEIIDSPVGQLTAHPESGPKLVQRVQRVGKSWDEHPDWPCRGYYVQLLLAVAGLSRIVEWWEAEKGFWNFEEEDEEDVMFDQKFVFASKAQAATLEHTSSEQANLPPSSSTAPALLPLNSPENVVEKPLPTGDKETPIDSFQTGAQLSKEDAMDTSMEQSRRSFEIDDDQLNQAVGVIRSETLVMELGLDGETFVYLSPVWKQLVGLDPSDCLGYSVTDLLHPDDADVFVVATEQLQADDSHTVEVGFKIRQLGVEQDETAETDENDDPTSYRYIEVEGKGMLMHDRLESIPSHTMWVIRTAVTSLEEVTGIPRTDLQAVQEALRYPNRAKASSESGSPLQLSFLQAPQLQLLCRICERQIPTWFFERHNETCDETHRLEQNVTESNENLSELRQNVQDLQDFCLQNLPPSPALLPQGTGAPPAVKGVADYRGISLLSPPSTPPTSSLRSTEVMLRKHQTKVLESLSDILQTAVDISTPSVGDDGSATSHETNVQLNEEDLRVLSPTSEDKLIQISKWKPPHTDDPALAQLVSDVTEQIRAKGNNVNRLRNTILYAETVRLEWISTMQKAIDSRKDNVVDNDKGNEPPALEPSSSPGTSAGFLMLNETNEGNHTKPVDQETYGPGLSESQMTARNEQHSSGEVGQKTLQSTPANGISAAVKGSPPRRPSGTSSSGAGSIPLSPKIPTAAPVSRHRIASIKDFEVLKPISKGAYGSVFLAKKKITGDYYAIKVLKKSDMVTKNQVKNVKAERKIMILQAEADFVVKLFYTFQSHDYLYLVMEYMNGGDLGALIQALGCLDEDWARDYLAEVVLGLEYLHDHGIVHRDLKPANLLIDSRGHLKLIDFGLSKVGLLGRQAIVQGSLRDRKPKNGSKREPSAPQNLPTSTSAATTPEVVPIKLPPAQRSYFNYISSEHNEDYASESSESSNRHRRTESGALVGSPVSLGSNAGMMATGLSGKTSADSDAARAHVAGTPDYLAPESILGLGSSEAVDWWAVGVTLYEMLYGIPPFNAETAERVFENIISRNVDWHEDLVDFSSAARNLMERLLCLDPDERLGTSGAIEVKQHPFFKGINWDTHRTSDAPFVPHSSDPESTDYFDARGAAILPHFFTDEEPAAVEIIRPQPQNRGKDEKDKVPVKEKESPTGRARSESLQVPDNNFGAFNFKNVESLKQVNDDMIKKLRDDLSASQGSSQGSSNEMSTAVSPLARTAPLSGKLSSKKENRLSSSASSSSPSASSSSATSVVPGPRANAPIVTPNTHARQPSEQSPALSRVRASSQAMTQDHFRRNSLPTRLRQTSFSNNERPPVPDAWGHQQRTSATPGSEAAPSPSATSGTGHNSLSLSFSPPSAESSLMSKGVSQSFQKSIGRAPVDCLIAEDNPISSKVLETILSRLGCRVVVVQNGEEAIRCSMGEICFDVIFMDLRMPILDGDSAARMIKSTKNSNQETPIVAVSSYELPQISQTSTLFASIMAKPVTKPTVVETLRDLGFLAVSTASKAKPPGESQTRPS